MIFKRDHKISRTKSKWYSDDKTGYFNSSQISPAQISPLKITLILRFDELTKDCNRVGTRGLEGVDPISNRWRMLPAFPSTRAPAPAASSPRRRRSDFSRTRAPASATDWGWRPSLFSSASWMAGGESLVCRDLERTEARNTHELLNVTPRLRDEIILVIYATTRERNCRVGSHSF